MKDIPGYEGLYSINENGEVFSHYHKYRNNVGQSIRKLKPGVSEGYPVVNLYKNTKARSRKVHRLMAITFLNHTDPNLQINHINGDRMDCRLLNLELCTASQNIAHSYKVLNRQPISGSRTPRSKLVLDTQTGIYYDSVRFAAQAKGINRAYLKNAIRLKGIYRGLIYA